MNIPGSRTSIRGIGIDMEDNSRIGRMILKWGETFTGRIFTENEIAYCSPKHDKFASFTARFAAKEALFKAIGTGLRDGYKWKEIEILNDHLGKPYFRFYGRVKETIGKDRVLVSLSHTAQISFAFVVIEHSFEGGKYD